jgi:hypothetical protein
VPPSVEIPAKIVAAPQNAAPEKPAERVALLAMQPAAQAPALPRNVTLLKTLKTGDLPQGDSGAPKPGHEPPKAAVDADWGEADPVETAAHAPSAAAPAVQPSLEPSRAPVPAEPTATQASVSSPPVAWLNALRVAVFRAGGAGELRIVPLASGHAVPEGAAMAVLVPIHDTDSQALSRLLQPEKAEGI